MTMTNSCKLTPFRLKPVFAERIWGRTDLKPWFEETGTSARVGEAWLTGPECTILDGEHAGRTLGDLAQQCVGSLGDGEFPLLVKLLFPEDKLSVQVHPDDAEAQAKGQKRGKTECWYVLQADPGATVACGLKPGIGVGDLERGAADGTMEQMLQMIPVQAGDMVFVDAGTVHAIGPGVTLLEVQQTCDVTYRLFDYGRPRELHLREGLAVVKTKTAAGKIKPRKMADGGFTRLIETKYFVVDEFTMAPGTAFEMRMEGVGCVVGLRGQSAVDSVRFNAGVAVVVPVGSVTISSQAGGKFVRCWTPED
jgi:mannose-6-phosphate isomerase